MCKMYCYKVIRENPVTGEQGKRTKKLYSFDDHLKVGGLYVHLGSGFPGFQRVLSMTVEEYEDGESCCSSEDVAQDNQIMDYA